MPSLMRSRPPTYFWRCRAPVLALAHRHQIGGRLLRLPLRTAGAMFFNERARIGVSALAHTEVANAEMVPFGALLSYGPDFLDYFRRAVRPFTDKQIELATTFADQAGIAIENVRLFDEIQEKSHQLEIASQHKSQFLANMSHELRTNSMPSSATRNSFLTTSMARRRTRCARCSIACRPTASISLA
jgi:signal transduction histidine kinase